MLLINSIVAKIVDRPCITHFSFAWNNKIKQSYKGAKIIAIIFYFAGKVF